jgi:mRNA-degrading endonuclease RelE of RelBE toxin-antitoxin system
VTPTVALSDEFLESLDRLPSGPQKKVREFIRKFRADPKSNAINYERLQGHKDGHVRTVRIDRKYRAVMMHPDEGDVYVLLWVDDHDEAMNWAKRRSFEVNPRTGALQVYSVEEASRSGRGPPGSRGSSMATATTCCSRSACPRSSSPPCGQ